MGGKKTVEKSREWEKERRGKLNNGFFELSKLLPDHDPSMVLSKKEILIQAAQYIKELQKQNQEILKEGTDDILKMESERLKRRVAHLLLRTKLLVDALRTAGVPIPNPKKKKKRQDQKNSPQPKTFPINQNKPHGHSGSILKGEEAQNLSDDKSVKKKVKCVCDKVRSNINNKKPLKEVNTTIEASVTSSESGKTNGSSVVSIPFLEDKGIETSKTSASIVVSVSQPNILNNSIMATRIQPLPVLERNLLSSLGPGTLILADGRIVNVPPIVPQILVKPQPTVIFMQNAKKKEKILYPKKTEITKTTFANKAPIPAIKHYRLEPHPRTVKAKVKRSKMTTSSKNLISSKSKKNVEISNRQPVVSGEKEKSNANMESENQINEIPDHVETPPLNELPVASTDLGLKRKSNEEANYESNKVVKISESMTLENREESSTQQATESVPEPVVSDIREAAEKITEAVENISGRKDNEANNCSEPLLIDKEDILKSSATTKHTIDALFNKGEENETASKNSVPEGTETGLSEIAPKTSNQESIQFEKTDEPLRKDSEAACESHAAPEPTEVCNDTQKSDQILSSERTNEKMDSAEIPAKVADPPLQQSSLEITSENLAQTQPTLELTVRSTDRFNEKLYSTSSETSGFKSDCVLSADFLRTKDLERNTFMPIIDDVRLTSDFSSDLFNSLQVPTGGQHPESISPTAAFLLAFPLVSTSKNTENLNENENHENQTSTPTTILQIGNIDPPSTEIFHSIDYNAQKNSKTNEIGKDIDRYQNFEINHDFESNMNHSEIAVKGYRNLNEKKKDVLMYTPNEEYPDKTQRRVNCEINNMPEERVSKMKEVLPSVGTNTYQQSYSYPRFTSCNDFSALPPPQYASTDPKSDAGSTAPWPSTMEYSHTNPMEKEPFINQKNKHTYDRKSKTDKTGPKGCNYASVYSHNPFQTPDCYNFKADKKKVKQHPSKLPVNWMTTPDSRNAQLDALPHLDVYTPQKDCETSTFNITTTGQNLFTNTFTSIEMSIDSFPEFCNPKKTSNTYSWSPSKSLLPTLDNHGLVIPSTLPTLVGDLALGTSTPSESFKTFENKKYEHSMKKSSEKADIGNGNDRIKKRNEFSSKTHVNNSSFLSVSQLVDPKCKKQTKPPEVKQTCSKKHSASDKNVKPRTNCNYVANRKDNTEPNCMYWSDKNNFLPNLSNQWNDKQRNQYKGGSYSAESLIGVQQNMTQEPSDPFHSNFNTYQSQTTTTNHFQNTDYNHQNIHDNMQPTQQYQNCFNFSTQSHFSTYISEEYQMDNFSFNPTHCQPSHSQAKQKRQSKCRDDNYQAGFIQPQVYPSYPKTSYPPPCSSSSHHLTTNTLTNFNLSTIFPEMNDQRVSSSVQTSHLNTSYSNLTPHNYPAQPLH